MTRAIAFGLATLALGLFIRTAVPQAAAEVTAREADGKRPATIKEIRSLLKELAEVSGDLETTEEAFAPGALFCTQDRPYSGPEVARMIRCAVRRFGGDADRVVRMASCESGLRANARGGAGGNYRGVFQYAASTWASAAGDFWRPAWGARHVQIPGIYNGRAQAIVTVRYVNARGYGPWAGGACA